MNDDWGTSLPPHVKAKLKEAAPELPVAFVEMICAMYLRERGERPEAASKVRGSLERIRSRAGDLDVLLGAMSREAHGEFQRAAQQVGRPDLLSEAHHLLQLLYGIGRNAAAGVTASAGRERSARRKMVGRLIDVMRGHGLEPTTSRDGLLHYLAQTIIAQGAGEEIGEALDKAIARELDTIAAA